LATDALAISGLNVLYGESHVLRNLSFTLREGRVLALLGRNGVGKSTCVNTAIGFLRPRDGTIRLFGEPVQGMPPESIVRRGMAIVPQGRRIFPTLSVEENLTVAGMIRKGRKQRSLGDIYEMFPRLRERRMNMACNLSGGEQQMLAIGRALMTNPKVLLLDEPSEGLAPQLVNEVCDSIIRLKQEGMSIILVEQNLAMSIKAADDVVILNSSGITFEGTAEEIRDKTEFLNQQLGVC
jgi:branched-chain amino acid transport system ATP-binding protein